jgi:conjugative transfer signal peptidase TraF
MTEWTLGLFAVRKRALRATAWVGFAAITLAAASVATVFDTTRPLVLFNTTPSEPTGFYLASPTPVSVGQIAAFRAPPAAFPYADLRLAYLHRTPMLKAIAATAGDNVCTRGGRLRINGRDRAAIAQRDSRGVALPHWLACRRLVGGEVFVFSDRVPNSFDSRYFGPVREAAMIGVYRPFSTGPGAS